MKSILFAPFFALFFIEQQPLFAQNLVVNPSFELPAESGKLIPPGEFNPNRLQGWSSPTPAQATLYSSIPTLATLNRALSKWKFTAKTGNNVVGLSTFGSVPPNNENELREYVQGTLSRPLTVGKKYYVSYQVHFHCEGTNNIGFAFQTTPLSTRVLFRLNQTPQVNTKRLISYTKGWQMVRDSFVADAAHTYFVIGNFYKNEETKVESNKLRYHKAYLDDISVEEAVEQIALPQSFETLVEKPTSHNSANNSNTSTPTPSANKGDILLLDKVLFALNSAALLSESSNQLDKLVAYLEKNTATRILIKGHTSGEGSEEYNQKLSEQRAQSVAAYLTQKGISKERIPAKGFGKSQPIVTNETEDGRQKNRRVEFEILDK